MMQLTTQMLAEIGSIQTRVYSIANEIIKPMSSAMIFEEPNKVEFEIRDRKSRAIIAELNPYKVRLENILCETDRKERAHSH